jgi:hypothetical protein
MDDLLDAARQQLFGLSYKSQLFMSLFQWLTDIKDGASSNAPLSPKKVAAVLGLEPEAVSQTAEVLKGLDVATLRLILQALPPAEPGERLRQAANAIVNPGTYRLVGEALDERNRPLIDAIVRNARKHKLIGMLMNKRVVDQVDALLSYVPQDVSVLDINEHVEGLLRDTDVVRRVFGPYPLAAATKGAVYLVVISGACLFVLGLAKGTRAAYRNRRKIAKSLSDPRIIIVIACMLFALSAASLLALAPKLLQQVGSFSNKTPTHQTPTRPPPAPPAAASSPRRQKATAKASSSVVQPESSWWNWFIGRR